MCGIVAYKGHKNCYPILLDGLHKLEYRGYDSAGVACLTENGKIVVALIDDHEAMLKRLRRKGKTIALESANRNYETKIFGPDRVKVQGILVSLYRNFH